MLISSGIGRGGSMRPKQVELEVVQIAAHALMERLRSLLPEPPVLLFFVIHIQRGSLGCSQALAGGKYVARRAYPRLDGVLVVEP